MFSTCSELIPRAPIPDGRMERIMQPCYSAQVPRVRVQVLGHKRVQLQRSVTPSELTLSDFVAFGSSIGINVVHINTRLKY